MKLHDRDADRATAEKLGVPSALSVESLSKTFGSVVALRSLDLEIQAGEVHALLGENGSGKSTLIKILAGYHQPDSGGIVKVAGEQLAFDSGESYVRGCRFVHQDLGLVGSSSIIDNLSFGSGFSSFFGTIRRRRATEEARADLSRVGLNVDPHRLVEDLSASERTAVAVARALRRDEDVDVHLLVLDEPTATLPANEVHELLSIVRQVARSGVSVLYVTHRLDEVFSVADRVSVIRDGIKISTDPIETVDHESIVERLLGRQLEAMTDDASQIGSHAGREVLSVSSLASESLADVTLSGRSGEILGIAGIAGSGRDTLLGAIFGSRARERGLVRIGNDELPPERPDLSIALGMAYLPPDRKLSSGFMDLSARENMSLGVIGDYWKKFIVHKRIEKQDSIDWFQRLNVRPAGTTEKLLSTFSGGNQQKILFAKWLRKDPLVFLLDEPTQGVDVGAKAELHRLLRGHAAGGASVIVASSDGRELADICDRVIVIAHGRVVAQLQGELSEELLVQWSLAEPSPRGEIAQVEV